MPCEGFFISATARQSSRAPRLRFHTRHALQWRIHATDFTSLTDTRKAAISRIKATLFTPRAAASAPFSHAPSRKQQAASAEAPRRRFQQQRTAHAQAAPYYEKRWPPAPGCAYAATIRGQASPSPPSRPNGHLPSFRPAGRAQMMAAGAIGQQTVPKPA